MHHEHYQEYSKKVCDAMIQVIRDGEAPVEKGTAGELKTRFENYMAPLLAKTRSRVSEILQIPMMSERPSKPTFDEVHNETRTKHHNEIDLWARSALAEQRREQRMATTITYNNLNGANARIVINSNDYSINIANSQPIFQGIKETIREGVEEEQLREQLLAKTTELDLGLSTAGAEGRVCLEQSCRET